MPLVYSTYPVAEVANTRNESGDIATGYTASVQLDVAKEYKDLVVEELLYNQFPCPFVLGLNPPTVKKISVLPLHMTDLNTNTPLPIDGQGYDYGAYRLTVNYSNTITTIVAEEIEPVAEFIRLDHRMFRWSGGAPLTEGEAPGFLYQRLNLVFKYVNQLLVPAEVLTGIGKCHSAAWTSPTLGLTFGPETLMYMPAPLSTTKTTNGSTGFNYTTKFGYRPNGWNKYWRPQSQAWESMYLADGSTEYKSYPPANLSALLPI